MGRFYRDYVDLMAHFDAVLPGRIHRVFYERMVEDTETEVRRLLDYCGLPFEAGCLRFFENERPVRTAELRAGPPAHLPRRDRPMAALRGVARPPQGRARPGPRRLPGRPRVSDCRTLRPRDALQLPLLRYCRFGRSLCRHWTLTGEWQCRLSFRSVRIVLLARTPIASAVLLALASPALMAQETSTTLGEVIVTAQKRAENLQDVPISIEALDNESLEELNIQNFKDYVQFLPTRDDAAVHRRGLRLQRRSTCAASRPAATARRHLAAERRHYLDEQPITTIQGNLDVHLYDIARVEALAGPQGTLYGASSQAGTIRIITNKPDPSGFAAGYSLEGNFVDERRRRLRRRRLRQPPDRRQRGHPARRLGHARGGLDRQRGGEPALYPGDRRRSG